MVMSPSFFSITGTDQFPEGEAGHRAIPCPVRDISDTFHPAAKAQQTLWCGTDSRRTLRRRVQTLEAPLFSSIRWMETLRTKERRGGNTSFTE